MGSKEMALEAHDWFWCSLGDACLTHRMMCFIVTE